MIFSQIWNLIKSIENLSIENTVNELNNYYIQGVPLNMEIERRLEYRLWYLIIDNWNRIQQRSTELSKMWSTFSVSLNFVFIIWNLEKFYIISVYFKCNKMEVKFWKSQALFIVKCFKCFNFDTTKLYLQNNPAWIKGDIEMSFNSHVYWDTLYNVNA